MENPTRPLNIEGKTEEAQREIGEVKVGKEIEGGKIPSKPEVPLQPITPIEEEIKRRWEAKGVSLETEGGISPVVGPSKKEPSIDESIDELSGIFEKGSPFELQEALSKSRG